MTSSSDKCCNSIPVITPGPSCLDPDPNTAGGVRIAGLGGMWQTVVLGFGGVDLSGEILAIEPRLPPQWRALSFRICYRGRSVAVRLTTGQTEATLAAGEAMEIRIGDAVRRLELGATVQTPP